MLLSWDLALMFQNAGPLVPRNTEYQTAPNGYSSDWMGSKGPGNIPHHEPQFHKFYQTPVTLLSKA